MPGQGFVEMACTAGLLRMDTLKRESGFGMVKNDLFPSINIVAIQAPGVLKILGIHECVMDVIMAVGTFHPDISETPFFLLFMTGETGCG